MQTSSLLTSLVVVANVLACEKKLATTICRMKSIKAFIIKSFDPLKKKELHVSRSFLTPISTELKKNLNLYKNWISLPNTLGF